MLMSAVSLLTFWWREIFPTESGKSPPFNFTADKLYNNHSVSRPPPGLRFQFCTFVPRYSHESTLNFCSRQRGSALQWPFDSLPLKQFLKGWKIILWLQYPSLAATCGSSLTTLQRMSDGASGASGFCSSPPSSTLLPTFCGTGDSFVLVNLSLCWENEGSSGEDAAQEKCVLQTHLFVLT